MSNKKRFEKHPRKTAKTPAVVLSPEEQAKLLAAREKAATEEKAERERIELYGKCVPKMSHRQLRGELRRVIKREYAGKPPEPQAGLNIALGTILLAVLENTHTAEPRKYRLDQINQAGRLHFSPR